MTETTTRPITEWDAISAGWYPGQWTKCPDCLAEVRRWMKDDDELFFSNGGKLHSRVCAMNQAFDIANAANDPQRMRQQAQGMQGMTNMAATASIAVNDNWGFQFHGPLIKNKVTIEKPKLHVAPPAGKRMIKFEDEK